MTTFQDPPPQSRRAVRQSERGEQASPVEGLAPAPIAQPEQPKPYAFDPGGRDDLWDTVSRLTATPPGQPAPQSGRRAQAPQVPQAPEQHVAQAPVSEPLNYSTQSRPQVPTYDGTSFSGVPIAPAEPVTPPAPAWGLTPSAVPAPVPAPLPAPIDSAPTGFRERDFSPEGRRASLQREQALQSRQAEAPANIEAAVPASDINYQTQGIRHVEPMGERTLSRRELREMRDAAERAPEPIQEAMPEAIDTLLLSGPIELPVLAPPPGQSQALADAMAEFDALTRTNRGRRAADGQADASPSPGADIQPPVIQPPVIQAPVIQPTISPAPVARVPIAPAPVVAPAPIPLFQPVAIEPDVADTTTSPVRRSGHWSEQVDEDDDFASVENTITRSVGAAQTVTTSALVLPSMPTSNLTSPLSATGEILLTGSINLPLSLGSTGALPHRIDTSDLDDDVIDQEIVTTDSAPVSAISAVTTHTAARGMIVAKKPGGNRTNTIMLVTAGVLAVAVVALMVIAAFAMKIF